MVIDYRYADQATAARQVLAAAEIGAVYTPYRLAGARESPETTQWIVHRVEVDAADAVRAGECLAGHGLTDAPVS